MTEENLGELIPDEHVKIAEDTEAGRWDVEIEPLDDDRRGGVIKGLTPPFYAPAVERIRPGVYRVMQAGNDDERVCVDRRTCTCPDREQYGMWCLHLRAALLYHTRGCDQ